MPSHHEPLAVGHEARADQRPQRHAPRGAEHVVVEFPLEGVERREKDEEEADAVEPAPGDDGFEVGSGRDGGRGTRDGWSDNRRRHGLGGDRLGLLADAEAPLQLRDAAEQLRDPDEIALVHVAQPREGDDAERRPDDEQDAEESYEHNCHLRSTILRLTGGGVKQTARQPSILWFARSPFYRAPRANGLSRRRNRHRPSSSHTIPDDVAIVRCCILSTVTKRGLLLQNGLRTVRARTAARPAGRSQPRRPAARRVCWEVESPSAP